MTIEGQIPPRRIEVKSPSQLSYDFLADAFSFMREKGWPTTPIKAYESKVIRGAKSTTRALCHADNLVLEAQNLLAMKQTLKSLSREEMAAFLESHSSPQERSSNFAATVDLVDEARRRSIRSLNYLIMKNYVQTYQSHLQPGDKTLALEKPLQGAALIAKQASAIRNKQAAEIKPGPVEKAVSFEQLLAKAIEAETINVQTEIAQRVAAVTPRRVIEQPRQAPSLRDRIFQVARIATAGTVIGSSFAGVSAFLAIKFGEFLAHTDLSRFAAAQLARLRSPAIYEPVSANAGLEATRQLAQQLGTSTPVQETQLTIPPTVPPTEPPPVTRAATAEPLTPTATKPATKTPVPPTATKPPEPSPTQLPPTATPRPPTATPAPPQIETAQQSSELAAIPRPFQEIYRRVQKIRLERAKTDPEYLKRAPEALNKQVINIFILGMDLRPGEKVGRADTIMALSFNPITNQIITISIPRDIHSPEVTQIANASGYEGNFRINAATVFFKSLEGPRKVIEDATGLSGDFVVQIDLNAFEKLVNAVGGIDIEAEVINDPKYPTADYGTKTVSISAGMQHMDGTIALEYARSRAGPDADYGRARRSRQVAMALIEKVLARTKSNPFSIIELINLVGRLQGEGNLRLSSELSLPDMLAIAADQVTHPQDINQIKIPQVQGAVSAETVASQVRDPKDQYQIIITPGVEEPIPYWGPLRTKVKQALAAAAPTPPPSAPPAVAAPPATPAPDAGAAGGETKK